ncbi:MAG: hypothetical protein ABI307_10405 [Mycobacterium sp.]
MPIAAADLQNPDTYQLTPLVDNLALSMLLDAAAGAGFTTNADSSSVSGLFSSWVATWFDSPPVGALGL